MPPIDLNVVLAALSLLLFLAFVGFFAFLVFHQSSIEPREPTGAELIEQHYAPGETIEQPTPYYVAPIPAAPDPLEISANLDKKIILGAGMLFAIFALVGAYFLANPTIRARGAEDQQQRSIMRGRNLYANFCFDCHGKTGLGSTDPERKDLPGLPLNKPQFKYENIKNDPAALKTTQDLIQRTIERGRAKPAPLISMPAWGQADGGALNDEQITQLVTFIMYGTDQDWADVVTVRQQSGLPTEPNPPKPQQLTPVQLGQQLFTSNPQTPCVTCHSADPNKPSPLANAPNLGHYGTEGPLNAENKAKKAAGDADWLLHWIQNPPAVKPGVVMPPFGTAAGGQLSDDQIRAIIEYLMSLK